MKDFTRIAAPLTDLTKKNVKFVGDGKCQEAFEDLKEALCRKLLENLGNVVSLKQRNNLVQEDDAVLSSFPLFIVFTYFLRRSNMKRNA